MLVVCYDFDVILNPGASLTDVKSFVEDFYDARIIFPNEQDTRFSATASIYALGVQNVDQVFVQKLWTWLLSQPDIQGATDQDSVLNLNSTSSRSLLKTRVGQEIENIEDDHVIEERVRAAPDRSWRAITGHGEDSSKVSALEFVLLSIIGMHGKAGVLQPDLVSRSGQDKRSVPKRTDSLQTKGYIEKRPVLMYGARTSLCTLRRFVPEPGGNVQYAASPTRLTSTFQDASTSKTVVDMIIDIFRKHDSLAARQLFDYMGILPDQNRELRAVLRLLNCLRRHGFIESLLSEDIDQPSRYKLVKNPSLEERQRLNVTLSRANRLCLNMGDDSAQLDSPSILGARARMELQTANKVYLNDTGRLSPQWSPEISCANMVYRVIDQSGLNGLSITDACLSFGGAFYRRPAHNLLTRIGDAWPNYQPAQLSHMSLVKDTAMLEKGIQYVYRSFHNFGEAVKAGTASWEGAGVAGGPSLALAGWSNQVAENILQDRRLWATVQELELYQDGSATLSGAQIALHSSPEAAGTSKSTRVGPGTQQRSCRAEEALITSSDVQFEVMNRKGEISLADKRPRGRPRKHPLGERRSSRERARREAIKKWKVDWDLRIQLRAEDLARAELKQMIPSNHDAAPNLNLDDADASSTRDAPIPSLHRPAKRRKLRSTAARELSSSGLRSFSPLSDDRRQDGIAASANRSPEKPASLEDPNNYKRFKETSVDHLAMRTEILYDQLSKLLIPGVYINPPSAFSKVYTTNDANTFLVVFKTTKLMSLDWFAGFQSSTTALPEVMDEDRSDISGEKRQDHLPDVAFSEREDHQEASASSTILPRSADAHGGSDLNQKKTIAERTDESSILHNIVHSINKPLENAIPHVGDALDKVKSPPHSTAAKEMNIEGVGFNKVREGGGTVALKRSQVIMDIIEKAGGAYPGDDELRRPFTVAWQNIANKQTPERRTVQAAVNALIDGGKLRRLTFMFTARNGIQVTKHILTKLDLSPDCDLVMWMQKRIIEKFPRIFNPNLEDFNKSTLPSPELTKSAEEHPERTMDETPDAHSRLPAWRHFRFEHAPEAAALENVEPATSKIPANHDLNPSGPILAKTNSLSWQVFSVEDMALNDKSGTLYHVPEKSTTRAESIPTQGSNNEPPYEDVQRPHRNKMFAKLDFVQTASSNEQRSNEPVQALHAVDSLGVEANLKSKDSSLGQSPVHSNRMWSSKNRKPRGPQSDVLLSPQETERFILTVTVIQTLLGGVERDLDWALIERVFKSTLDTKTLKSRYGHLRGKNKAHIQHLRNKFQDAFLAGYQNHEIAPLDYSNVGSYDWESLIHWAEININKIKLLGGPLLPASHASLGQKFVVEDDQVVEEVPDELYSTITTVLRREEIVSQIPFSEYLSDTGWEDASSCAVINRHIQDLHQSLDLVDTVVRANMLTPPQHYNAMLARSKLMTFGDAALNESIEKLSRMKLVTYKGKSLGNTSERYQLSDRVMATLRKSFDKRSMFQMATQQQERLEQTFAESQEPTVSYHSSDGEMMAILELISARQIDITISLPPIDLDTLAPNDRQHLSIWGIPGGNYKTGRLNRDKLVFDLVLSPTSEDENKLPETKTSIAPPCEHIGDPKARIPLWYDIHDRPIEDLWNMIIQSTLTTIVLRPGMTLQRLLKHFKGGLEDWEAMEILNWLSAVGCIRRLQDGWMAVPGWWRVFGKGTQVS